MPHRFTPLESGMRAYHGASRATVNETKDDPMMQEVAGDMMHSEARKGMEFVQNYGFSTRVLPRDQGGESGQSGGMKGPAAEMHISYPGGNRNHPMITAMDDRRHRIRNLKEGENSQYDDQGQATYLSREQLRIESPKDKGVIVQHYTKEDENQQGQQQSQSQQSGASGAQGGQKKKGRDMSKEVKPTSYVQTKKDEVVIFAKKKITLMIGDKVKLTITEDGTFLIGKQYHGVDSDGEKPSTKDEVISDTPAKQVWVKT